MATLGATVSSAEFPGASSMNQLGSDVTMTNANQFYDGPSLSLAAGTWLLMASIHYITQGIGTGVTAKLWDGTTVVASGETLSQSNGAEHQIELVGVVTIGSTTTYKVSSAATSAGHKMAAACGNNGAGNNASTLVAVRLA